MTEIHVQYGPGQVEVVEFDRDLDAVSAAERGASIGRSLLRELRQIVHELRIDTAPGFDFNRFVDAAPFDEAARRAITLARASLPPGGEP